MWRSLKRGTSYAIAVMVVQIKLFGRTGGNGWFFFFQAEDGIRDYKVTGVQTCALPIWSPGPARSPSRASRARGPNSSSSCRCGKRRSAARPDGAPRYAQALAERADE